MTGTWETWSSMYCRLETWPHETSTVTRILLSRSTSYLGEGEFWPCWSLQERLVCVSLPASVSVLFISPLFSFWRCIDFAIFNFSSLYERMRMDTMTWGSHLSSLPSLSFFKTTDGCFRLHIKQCKHASSLAEFISTLLLYSFSYFSIDPAGFL